MFSESEQESFKKMFNIKTGKKKTKKKSKEKKEKDKRPLTEAEKKIEDKKKELNNIYDCLMNQGCLIQYGKYGSYIPLEQVGQMFDIRVA